MWWHGTSWGIRCGSDQRMGCEVKLTRTFRLWLLALSITAQALISRDAMGQGPPAKLKLEMEKLASIIEATKVRIELGKKTLLAHSTARSAVQLAIEKHEKAAESCAASRQRQRETSIAALNEWTVACNAATNRNRDQIAILKSEIEKITKTAGHIEANVNQAVEQQAEQIHRKKILDALVGASMAVEKAR